MGPTPSPLPERACGEATLRLTIDPTHELIYVSCHSGWFTPDGQAGEATIQLQGDPDEGWELISECATWLWKRWKRPLNAATGPFGS